MYRLWIFTWFFFYSQGFVYAEEIDCDPGSFQDGSVPSRGSDDVGRLLSQVGSYPLLTVEEEQNITWEYAVLRRELMRVAFLDSAFSARIVKWLDEVVNLEQPTFQIDKIFNTSKQKSEVIKRIKQISRLHLPLLHHLTEKIREATPALFNKNTPARKRKSFWKQVYRSKLKIGELLLEIDFRMTWIRTRVLIDLKAKKEILSDLQSSPQSRRILVLRTALPIRRLESQVRDLERILERMTKIEQEVSLKNLRLVVSESKKKIESNSVLSNDDLPEMLNVGAEALLVSLYKFRPEMGNKFSTYAMTWIKQRLQNYGYARMGLKPHDSRSARKILKVESELRIILSRRPSPEEISAESGIPLDKVQRLLKREISLDSTDNAGDDQANYDAWGLAAPVDEGISQGSLATLRENIENSLGQLDEREAKILRLRFGLAPYTKEYTLHEVGAELEITRERVRQIEAKALSKLRQKEVTLKQDLDVSSIN